MSIVTSLQQRRSYYHIGKALPVPESRVVSLVRELTALVPDAFDMKSTRVVVALGAKHEALWDAVYDAFGGQVAREKLDGFQRGAGTILYYYDEQTVRSLQEKYPLYADSFPNWAQQSSAMLQISVWSGLRELRIGASLQHYNPVIDERVRALFDLPESYRLVAQMPFGGMLTEPEPKRKEDVDRRVRVER